MFLRSRRQVLRTVTRPYFRSSFLRRQHDAPHKTYFQDPSQPPQPVAPPISPKSQSTGRTWFGWMTSSIAAVSTGAVLGFGASLSLITWDYLQEPFEIGSEDDMEMREQIEEIFDDHVGILDIREDPDFQEINPFGHLSIDEQHQSLIPGSLNGTRGVISKTFWSDKVKTLHIFIFFGDGVEGWPDVVHGGLLSTVLVEAMELVAANTFPGNQAQTARLDIAYVKPVRPGSIYQIRAHPDDLILDMKNGTATVPDTEERRRGATILGAILDEASQGPNTRSNTYVEAKGTFTCPSTEKTENVTDVENR